MKTKLNPIRPNEISKEVAILHKAVKALGFKIDASELKQRKAGKQTKASIMAFQKTHKIIPEEGVLANEATLEAIQETLKKKGLLKTENSFPM